jgi:hypothetical protein
VLDIFFLPVACRRRPRTTSASLTIPTTCPGEGLEVPAVLRLHIHLEGRQHSCDGAVEGADYDQLDQAGDLEVLRQGLPRLVGHASVRCHLPGCGEHEAVELPEVVGRPAVSAMSTWTSSSDTPRSCPSSTWWLNSWAFPITQPTCRIASSRNLGSSSQMKRIAVPAGFALALVGPDRPLVLAVVVATSSAAVALPILQGTGGSAGAEDIAPPARRPRLVPMSVRVIQHGGRRTRPPCHEDS